MQEVAKKLKEEFPVEITSRWIYGNHQIPEETVHDDRVLESTRFAIEDYDDVVAAQAVVVFTDPPRTTTRGGKHVEVGIALGQNKTIYMVGQEIENIFYYLPQILKFPTVDHLIHFLKYNNEAWQRYGG